MCSSSDADESTNRDITISIAQRTCSHRCSFEQVWRRSCVSKVLEKALPLGKVVGTWTLGLSDNDEDAAGRSLARRRASCLQGHWRHAGSTCDLRRTKDRAFLRQTGGSCLRCLMLPPLSLVHSPGLVTHTQKIFRPFMHILTCSHVLLHLSSSFREFPCLRFCVFLVIFVCSCPFSAKKETHESRACGVRGRVRERFS